uniref:Uncharacterized protein n=1 Tax=Anguilla anguilla TaxID=7936 RepID=A0A0E9S6A0_ANGAN
MAMFHMNSDNWISKPRLPGQDKAEPVSLTPIRF